MTTEWLRAATLVVITLTPLLGCATPVGVRDVGLQAAQRSQAASAVVSGAPSEASRQVLGRLGLLEMFEKDQVATLDELHAITVEEPSRDRWFALAELSFLQAEARRRACREPGKRPDWVGRPTPCAEPRPYYVAASAYAWATLFPEAPFDHSFPPLDPRPRTAAVLYNLSTTRALVGSDGDVAWSEGIYRSHIGTLDVRIDHDSLQYGDRKLTDFQPIAPLEVRGLRNRYRFPGIGAPMAASLARRDDEIDQKGGHLADGLRVPITLLCRFDNPVSSLRSGELTAHIEGHSGLDTLTTEIEGKQIPLESEPSAALALTLEGSAIWDLELAGYLSGDLVAPDDGLIMMTPYSPGRIPLVLVHGTASSPARWAELLNELTADDVIRENFQFWLFVYTTGKPVLQSAAMLRNVLAETLDRIDPDDKDPALRRMVVAGHSQGGLLTKLTAVSSGNRFWESVNDQPFDSLDLPEDTRDFLSDAMFFERLPFVERVIFISTPHRGSFLAGRFLGRFAAGLASSPAQLVGVSVDLAKSGVVLVGDAVDAGLGAVGNDAAQRRNALDRMPSSVDNMDPDSSFNKVLSSISVESPVIANSIIPVRGGPPTDGQNDGVVEYLSAHIDEAESEFVVYHQGHSAQSNPLAINEVRRILREHLENEIRESVDDR